jgi:DNA-binding beta-propeller fold protein YncE
MSSLRLAGLAGMMALAGMVSFPDPAGAQANPFRQVQAPKPPPQMNGGEWGELIQLRVDSEDNVWVLHRCFKVVLGDPGVAPGHSDGLSADCLGAWAVYPPILKFSPSGVLLASMGIGLFGRPHGFAVDHEGNAWVTDVALTPGEAGAVVTKLSPTGEVLMTLGTPGVTGEGPNTFNRPSGVAVAPNGEIFVTDGEGPNNRVVKFSRDGRFIKAWGATGSEPGNFRTPHDITIDSRGRVFVADRGNSRVQIFDQDGNFIDEWRQFGRPSGVHVNRATDMLYVTDSQSNATVNPGFKRGIYIGSARTGEVLYFIPDPDLDKADATRISGASGVASDAADRVVYGADVAPRQLRQYVRP